MNQCIHHIDALQWFMGDVHSVFAYTATLLHKMEAEDIGIAVFRFKNGTLGTLEGSTIAYPENLEGSIAIFGERGSVKVAGTALNRKSFWKVEGDLEKEHNILVSEAVDQPSVYGLSHRHVIEEMFQAIREDHQPATYGSEGREIVL